MEPGTLVAAAAATGGRVTLENAPCEHLKAFIEIAEEVGVGLSCGTDTIEVDGSALNGPGYRPCDIETAPYPGLPTDLQPPTAVLLTQAKGISHIHEAIFEDRLEWLAEVAKMGAKVTMLDARHATIDGPSMLVGAAVDIGDLRAG